MHTHTHMPMPAAINSCCLQLDFIPPGHAHLNLANVRTAGMGQVEFTCPPPTLRRPPHLMHMHIVSARCKCMSGQYRVARHCLFPGSPPPPPPPSAYWLRSVMRKQKDSLGFHFFLSLFAEINAASPAPPQLAPPKSKPGVLGPAASLGSLLTAVADRGFRKSCLSMLTYTPHTTGARHLGCAAMLVQHAATGALLVPPSIVL